MQQPLAELDSTELKGVLLLPKTPITCKYCDYVRMYHFVALSMPRWDTENQLGSTTTGTTSQSEPKPTAHGARKEAATHTPTPIPLNSVGARGKHRCTPD